MKLLRFASVALLGLSLPLTAISNAAAQELPQFVAGEVRSADGTAIGFRTIGAGPPLVIVHGALGTGDSWLPVAAMLSSDFTVFVMTRRGRGISGDAAPAGYSLQKEAEDIIAVLEVAGDGAYLLGHSYGALAALEVARQAEIDKLVLYEPLLSVDAPYVPPGFTMYYDGLIAEGRLEDALTASLRELIAMSDEEITGLRAATPLWEGLVQLAPTFTREIAAIAELPLGAERYSVVTAQTLLLVGAQTPDLLSAGNRALQSVIPTSQIVLLENQAHGAQLLAPELVATEVRSFLLNPTPVADR